MFDSITQVGIRLTNFCNLQCYYCYLKDDFKNTREKFTDFDALTKFLEKLPLAEHVMVHLTGGEPSLAINDIKKACKSINKVRRKKNTTFYFVVYTNGTNIRGIIDLVEKGYILPENVHLSWDGLYSASRSRFIKNGKFDDKFFNDNIRFLSTLPGYIRDNIKIRTAAVSNTIDGLFDNFKFITDNGLKNWEYYIINNEESFKNKNFLKIVEEQLRKIYIYAKENNIEDCIYNLQDMVFVYLNPEKLSNNTKKKVISCRHLGRSIFVETNGSLHACAIAGENSSWSGDDLIFGSIYDGLDYEKMNNFSIDYNREPSCGLIYKGEPCNALHCFECMVTCKTILGSLSAKQCNQCDLRHLEMKLFKEIFARDTFNDDTFKIYQNKINEVMHINEELNPNLPFKK